MREGLKKHSTAHAYFLTLKERANSGGLTAVEWDWYRARQKEWEPEVLVAEQAAAARNYSLKHARSLSADDIKMILDEKIALNLNKQER